MTFDENDRCLTCGDWIENHEYLCSVTGRFVHEPCPESHTECEGSK